MIEHLEYYTSKDKATTRYNLDHTTATKSEESTTTYLDTIPSFSEQIIKETAARYILLGIPEDIGIRANMGRPGANESWNEFLNFFLHLPDLSNKNELLIAGQVVVADLMEQAAHLDANIHADRFKLSELTKQLDDRVHNVVTALAAFNKTVIVIGGGHNNAYPLLKAYGEKQAVNCINIDAHTDLRAAVGRHSGNGFSHAIEEGYLNQYAIIGLQEQYLNKTMQDYFKQDGINYIEYDIGFNTTVALESLDKMRLTQSPYGLEIDTDVVAHFPSSAQSPVGLSILELRRIIKSILKSSKNLPRYIHICEAAPRYGYSNLVAKTITTLLQDITTDY